MAWVEWAFSSTKTVPAELVSVKWQDVDKLVDGQYGANFYILGALADLNALDVYPAVRLNTAPPDQWYNRDAANNAAVYAAQTGGEVYEITEAWVEMTYEEARRKARDDLEIYFKAYDTSFFEIQSKWFSAADDSYLQYTKINNRIRGLMTGAAKVEPFDPPEVVFDVNEDANPFTLLNEWEAFCRRLDTLSVDARTITLGTWNAVQAATTTDEVRTIMADHYINNPIPAPPPI